MKAGAGDARGSEQSRGPVHQTGAEKRAIRDEKRVLEAEFSSQLTETLEGAMGKNSSRARMKVEWPATRLRHPGGFVRK